MTRLRIPGLADTLPRWVSRPWWSKARKGREVHHGDQ